MNLKNIDHLNLTVANFDETVAWYGRVFGFELPPQPPLPPSDSPDAAGDGYRPLPLF